MKVRQFVVGVDSSVPARAAIRWALAAARERDCPVMLVHVADDDWGVVGARLIDEVNDGAERLLREELAYARSLDDTVRVLAELRAGSPMWELAELSGPDVMLVVGTHKSGFHYGRAFGSRSLQLANLAIGPVAVIPEAGSRLRRGVIAGVDDTPAGLAAVALAADFACDRHCELTVVRASVLSVPVSPDADDIMQDWQSRRDDKARKLLREAVELARRTQPGIEIRSRVVRRAPGAALNDLARSAELLVVGDSRRAHGQLGSLGAVAYDVLLNLSSPTIVVHAPAPQEAARPSVPEGESHAVG